MIRTLRFAAIWLLLFLALPQLSHGQNFTQMIKLIENDRGGVASNGRAASDQFGYSVDVSGNYAVIGATFEDEDANSGTFLASAGSAYIFQRNTTTNTWALQQKVAAADRAAGDNFGYSVAISGDVVIVGAYHKNFNAGAAYIFQRDITTNIWGQQKIVSTDLQNGDLFGFSVAIDGDYAVVGASSEDENAVGMATLNNAGSAYIFQRNTTTSTWVQQQKIVATDRGANDNFGTSVAISGNYAIVGASTEDEDAVSGNFLSAAGSAYIFQRSTATNTWAQQQKIVAADRGAGDNFGISVAISGNYAIVGAYQEDEDAAATPANTLTDAGSAYIFERNATINTWAQQQKLVAADRGAGDRFGLSVAISGDYVVVGAFNEDEDAAAPPAGTLADAGSAYIFERNTTTNTWTQQQKIVAADRGAGDRFGRSVAISGNYVFAGANTDDKDATATPANTLMDAGSAYFYERNTTTNTWAQQQKIVAAERPGEDNFGFSVAISSDYAIVGTRNEDEDAAGGNTVLNAGAAYIFQRSGATWGFLQKIVAADRGESDSFGTSVAISGDYIIVGASNEDQDASATNTLANAGSAYIFQRNTATNTWTQQQKIVAADRGAGDNFGYSVAISGDYVIVGAYNEDQDAAATPANTLTNAGSAYIFQRSGSTWTQQQKIVAADRGASDNFGYSVSVSGDYAIVGAYNEDQDVSAANTLNNAGSAYIFQRSGNTWAQQQKIVAADRGADDNFGYSVAISGDYAIVGAYNEDQDASATNTLTNAGSAYIFQRSGSTWTQQQKIVATDRGAGDNFGTSVAISGDYVIVGANNEDENASATPANTLTNAGAAYIFLRNGTTWVQQKKIVAADRGAGDNFGASVAISSNYVLVGAYLEDDDAGGGNSLSNAGSAYIFERNATPLPLTLLSFTATKAGETRNRIAWATATEQGLYSFEVTRSGDGRTFQAIGRAAGNGTSGSYTFYDEQPLSTINYYRLQMTDAGGRSTYSNVAIVSTGNNGTVTTVTVAPVPASHTITVNNTNAALAGTIATVVDMQGRVVGRLILGTVSTMDVQDWPAGIYSLKLANGAVVRLVKQ